MKDLKWWQWLLIYFLITGIAWKAYSLIAMKIKKDESPEIDVDID